MLMLVAFCLLFGVFLARYGAVILLPTTLSCVFLVVCWAQSQGISLGSAVLLAAVGVICLQASYFLAFYFSSSLPWRLNQWTPPALRMSTQLPAARAYERSDRE